MFHESFSISDQRAEGRDVDRLAAIDAGLDLEERTTGVGERRRLRLDRRELRRDDPAELGRPPAEQVGDPRQREPGLLERRHRRQPRELARAVDPPPARGAQGLNQPARLVEAQRAQGQPGLPGHLADVEHVLHADSCSG